MEEKEKLIRLWFDMWLRQKDLGIVDIFDGAVLYIESWGPKYEGLKAIVQWFNEWNKRGKVVFGILNSFFIRAIKPL